MKIIVILVLYFQINYCFKWLETIYKDTVIRAHRKRHSQAIKYLQTLDNVSLSNGSVSYPDLTVFIITTKRNKTKFEYLHQSIAGLHYGLKKANVPARFVVVFGGDAIDELIASKFKWFKIPDSFEYSQQSNDKISKECREYWHYIYVLNLTNSFKIKNLLLIEDDALAKPATGLNIKWLLQSRIKQIRYSKPKIIKLWAPKHYRKYPITLHDICELVSLIYIVFLVCSRLLCMSNNISLFICIFSLFICLIGGRDYILGNRPFMFLYTLKPSYSCCIPAVLFIDPDENVPQLIDWLTKNMHHTIDVMIRRYTRLHNIVDVTLEPDIFWHIGFESSVDHYRSWKTFLDIPGDLVVDSCRQMKRIYSWISK